MSDEEATQLNDVTLAPVRTFEEQVESAAQQILASIVTARERDRANKAVAARVSTLLAEAGIEEVPESARIEALALEELKGLEQAARQLAATERAQALYRAKHGRAPFVAGPQAVAAVGDPPKAPF